MIAKKALSMTMLAAFIAMMTAATLAQTDVNTSKNPTGSWVLTITPTTPPPFTAPASFVNITTLTADGGLTNAASFLASSGHGVWEKTGRYDVAMTFVHLLYDPAGAFVGTMKIRAKVTIKNSGKKGNGVFKADHFDAAGNLTHSWEGTIRARRMVLEAID